MDMQENIPLGPKTTMRIGGRARYYAELAAKGDVEDAVTFATGKKLPIVVLGGGSNTLFDDGVIEALVVRIVAQDVETRNEERGTRNIVVEAGKNLAQLINELAERDLDLSPLTGILGSIGGAIFGNAGQGHGGVWIGNYVRAVEAYVDGGWKTFTQDMCRFRYRNSAFKEACNVQRATCNVPPIIWSATLDVPSKPKEEVKAEIQRLLQRRIETQPHVKTAGSCFLSLPDGTPAWKVIDAAGLRGRSIGGVKISEKHANFLINEGKGTLADAKGLVDLIRKTVPTPLEVEMRFVGTTGETVL